MALIKGKAPNIDSVPTELFQEYMDATSMDLWKAIMEMLDFESMPIWLNIGLIVLIPKTRNRCQIGNWRPITFLSSVSKILVKLLAKCLQESLPQIVRPNQTKFMVGMNIADNIFFAQKAMEWAIPSRHDLAYSY